MRRTRPTSARASAAALSALLAVALLAGCMGQNTESVGSRRESGAPAAGQGSERGAAAPAERSGGESGNGRVASANGLAWSVPAAFQPDAPASSMRVAQYRLPANAEGTKDGELAVFFFGAGSGGGTQANIQRWAGQFEQEGGADPMSRARTDAFDAPSGLRVSTIELTGRYRSAMMGGGPSYDEPGWALYGAVVEGAGGPWFFKAVGPEALMRAYRDDLRSLFESVRLEAAQS